jgi:hypothetical protein
VVSKVDPPGSLISPLLFVNTDTIWKNKEIELVFSKPEEENCQSSV